MNYTRTSTKSETEPFIIGFNKKAGMLAHSGFFQNLFKAFQLWCCYFIVRVRTQSVYWLTCIVTVISGTNT